MILEVFSNLNDSMIQTKGEKGSEGSLWAWATIFMMGWKCQSAF